MTVLFFVTFFYWVIKIQRGPKYHSLRKHSLSFSNMLLGSVPLHSLMVNIWHVLCKFYRPLNGFSQRDFIYNSLLLSQ